MLVPVPGGGRRAGARLSRVGLLGGTFNPPHVGHLVCALQARAQLALDSVVLVPVSAPPHKAVEADPGVAHRVALCRAAVAADDRVGLCLLEIERGGASYTVDTLRALHDRGELTFIVGGDMALALPSWREPAAILSLARLGVAERAGARRRDIAAALKAALPGSAERLDFFEMPRLDISSSELRRMVAAGLPIRHLVPDAVAAYVAEHGLYQVPVAEEKPTA